MPAMGEFVPLCLTLNFLPGLVLLNIVFSLISLLYKLYFLLILSIIFQMLHEALNISFQCHPYASCPNNVHSASQPRSRILQGLHG
jgi:hypothetical protein